MSLTNIEIEKYLCPLLGRSFIGVFSKDEIPRISNGTCMIVNIQDAIDENGHQLPGTHWVALGRNNGYSWYVDSFGLAPLKSLRGRLPNPIVYSTRAVQDKNSIKCGYYAALFCIEVTKSKDKPEDVITQILNEFNEPNLKNNDKILMSKLRMYIKRIK